MVKDPSTRTRYLTWLVVLSILLLAALGAWVYELIFGLGATGMRDVISWGLYILSFAFFVKLSAGGLIVASSAEVFGIKGLKPLAKLGVLTAAVCVLVAGVSILPDLGRPDRLLNLFIYAHWSSPMIWDITIITLYFLLAVAELWLMSAKMPEAKRARGLKWAAGIGLPAAFALHSITAWIFGLQISRPFWNTALMAPLFVVSAILSGTALVSLILWILQRVDALVVRGETWRKLSGLMAVSLAIDLFFVLSDYLTVLWDGVPKDLQVLSTLLPGGGYQLFFWLEWVIGGAIPLLFLILPSLRRRVGLIAASAVLILVGVYAYQVELVVAGMANPLIQLPPGISLGTYVPGESVFQLVGHYTPTWVELTILLGLLALIALLVTLGYRYLSIKASLTEATPEAGDRLDTDGARRRIVRGEAT
ncbi:Polysulphide reductase, NrfD [Acididesulfobacillus acetoxydans]|uniref:Polysulfide reductase, NrfD n=1 Tax=Acididesulfobacillus acetoxydans TaxID=1561005 RepID=A0A8S0X6J7_9FIRM|nr:NrfD/PsrC family molybdoenzyme membrane anchor subunit [Acididesulfobacillus acetoxydans]CAA7602590.1 Polysulphide reductase, NrfD [Acididesulfobacillus acetoxydans]CEJ07263.1 Polysulfide reductase, NrfD [Acididesulfobacillus acetoxydans]